MKDLSRLCIHTMTNKPWSLEEIAENYKAAGVPAVSVWRQVLEGRSLADSKKLIDDAGIDVACVCRGGFFPSDSDQGRQEAIDDNRKAIDEAQGIGAPLLVLVCGAQPGISLDDSRKQIQDGIVEVLPQAKEAGVKLAIEPLHPMYAAERSAVNTMEQANDMVEAIGDEFVGVALDVYHTWWDPDLEAEIKRCADLKGLLAFHVCDWRSPTIDMLNDRGLMGEGVIDIPQIREWVDAAGFDGFIEVEIFSDRLWAVDQKQYLEDIKTAYLEHV